MTIDEMTECIDNLSKVIKETSITLYDATFAISQFLSAILPSSEDTIVSPNKKDDLEIFDQNDENMFLFKNGEYIIPIS